jgi:hypothetical protein
VNRTILAGALAAALTAPAIADDHIEIAFRNPIIEPDTRTVSRTPALLAMVILQAWDAINTNRKRTIGWNEDNPQYQPFARHGSVGMVLGFAAWDFVDHAIGRVLNVDPERVDLYQAEQSANGILFSNSGGSRR